MTNQQSGNRDAQPDKSARVRGRGVVARPSGFTPSAVVHGSGYGEHAASHTKQAFAGFVSTSGSPTGDILPYTRTLRSRSRVLYMAAPIACAALRTMRTNVVGRGLHLHTSIDADFLGMDHEQALAWGRNTEREFELWAASKDADALGLQDFYELQQLAYLAQLQSGDAFCVFRSAAETMVQPHTLRLQLIEADRVCTQGGSGIYNAQGVTLENGNAVYDGVEVDRITGAVVAYWLADKHPADMGALNWQRVPKTGHLTGMPNILHLMHQERPEQLRGVPFLAVAMESVLQLARYLSAESLAALMETYLTGYITTDSADSPIVGNSMIMPGFGDTEEDEPAERDLSALGPEPGGIHQLLPGESITFNKPQRPGTQFDPFVTSVCKQIGAALEIPSDVLLKCYNSSYSASRAALQDFWRVVMMQRDSFAADFCAPVYAEWMARAVAAGRIQAPGFFEDAGTRAAWLRHEWTGSAVMQLDPVKEASAMEIQVRNGWLTNSQATTQLNGGDYHSNAAEIEQENKYNHNVTNAE